MPAIIIGTIAFVSGFALNDAVATLIDEYYPKYDKNKKNSFYKLIYALSLILILTTIVCIIIKMDP